MKTYEFWLDFISLFLRFQLTISSNGIENALVPTGWQAIIRSNDDLFTDVYMRHSASMS